MKTHFKGMHYADIIPSYNFECQIPKMPLTFCNILDAYYMKDCVSKRLFKELSTY
jgi:hypothetical protein